MPSLWSSLEAIFAIIGLITTIGGSYWAIFIYAPTLQVHYSFVVPQKYNATHFTLGIQEYNGGVGMTALPYIYKDWGWNGQKTTLDISYYVYQPETIEYLNDSNHLAIVTDAKYVLVGHDLISIELLSGGSS